ncbi:ferrous iron transport protein A [Hazenella coriacea]|uniref:Ferrous iron transport protein A n=2 Tax=Hazenella coriacea TaxID=1179467 RepID=A0A4V2UUY7_9BACL|nr:FeoA family protein [Hazenella coriacea]TCS93667.1 ferrous iron transport protein A [Hazenella coriacea]
MQKEERSLYGCKVGDQFYISKIELEGTLRRRLLDLGFVPGAVIEVLQKSPLGDPVAYRVSNTTIALRKEESSQIFGTIQGGEPK